MKEELEKCGLETNQWDHETIAIHAHAILLKDPEKAVRCIFAGETVQKNDFETLARRACRSSIMAGDYLNKEKAESQRQQLLDCLDPLTCPHGRPTVIELSESFLDKQFLRT
jgi:DNA mismatch repair protein MutL